MAKLSEHDLTTLRFALSKKNDPEQTAIANLFTLGLYLITQGKVREGDKACQSALECLVMLSSISLKIIKNASDNLQELTKIVGAQGEFTRLIPKSEDSF